MLEKRSKARNEKHYRALSWASDVLLCLMTNGYPWVRSCSVSIHSCAYRQRVDEEVWLILISATETLSTMYRELIRGVDSFLGLSFSSSFWHPCSSQDIPWIPVPGLGRNILQKVLLKHAGWPFSVLLLTWIGFIWEIYVPMLQFWQMILVI